MTPSKTNQIERFVDLFRQGYEAWVEAGKIVSEELEKDPDFAEKVHRKNPEISCDTVYAFDRLGRKQLHPKMMISDSPGAKKLRRLNYSMQEKYSDQPVKLLVKTSEGWDTRSISAFDLTAEQANQVFDSDGIRSEAQQRTWIENKSAKSIVQIDETYRLVGRKLIVMQPCQFTAGQIARLLADMEG